MSTKLHRFSTVVLALSILGYLLFHTLATAAPNIIIFLADDLGYADIGANGCKDIPTPNIDSLAKNGVRFTDGYANHPVCSPSRAGLMSGRYQHRFGFEHNSGPERFAADNFGLPRSEPTLAERLIAQFNFCTSTRLLFCRIGFQQEQPSAARFHRDGLVELELAAS